MEMLKIKKRGVKIVARNRIEAIMGYRQKLIPIDNETALLLKEQDENFRKKFGRDPEPDDPVFFDPRYDTPTPYTKERIQELLSEVAGKSGVPIEKIMKIFLVSYQSA